jgi:hypothetical protein
MRAFIAIDLPDDVRNRLEDLQEDLPLGRPADPDQMHLTLAFLGEQRDNVIEEVHEALLGLRFPAFELQLKARHLRGPPAGPCCGPGCASRAPSRRSTPPLPALPARPRARTPRFRPRTSPLPASPHGAGEHERLDTF